jgi:hypothetical protein
MTTNKRIYPLAETPLERHVARWIDRYADHGYNNRTSLLSDLFYGGCSSGMVGHLVYYRDTLRFYRRFRAEIDAMFTELVQECGENPLRDWDNDDPLARDTGNQNLLAWFGFEETARRLADRAELGL